MAKKKHAGGHGGDERWLLTYSDLITLLLAFFIILYSLSKQDLERFQAVGRAFQATFGTVGFQGGMGVLNTPGGAELFDVGSLPASQRQFMGISAQLEQYAQEENLGENMAVNLRTEGIAITLSNAMLFPSGGVELGSDSKKTLATIAEVIRPIPNEVRIEAHTDNLPTESPIYPTNWELSAARAAVVTRYLIEIEGIDPTRLSILGYGEFRPLYQNDSREHRLMNRRADIVILYPSEKIAPAIDMMGSK